MHMFVISSFSRRQKLPNMSQGSFQEFLNVPQANTFVHSQFYSVYSVHIVLEYSDDEFE